MNTLMKLEKDFITRWGRNLEFPRVVSFAPGRVEILGNHTDYNDGLVLTAAIEQKTYFVGCERSDLMIEMVAYDLREIMTFPVSMLPESPKGHWSSYLLGVIKVLQERVPLSKGFSVVFGSDVPFAAGCSSSASIEASFLYFLKQILGVSLSLEEMAKMCQKAENQYAGVPCGLMDQWSVLHGKKNRFVFFDNRSLKTETIRIGEEDYALLIINTNIKHTLIDSLYRKRREECTEAVEICRRHGKSITHLRDLTVGDLPLIKSWMSKDIWNRVCHVVQENDRIMQLLNLPLEDRLTYLGQAMALSHDSSKVLFENSCKELDFIEEECRKEKGCYGAKLSGGGFGGCVVALFDPELAKDFSLRLSSIYEKNFPMAEPLRITVSSLGEAAGLLA